MILSTDVTLPREQTPQFPDACVVCHRPGPEGRLKVSTRVGSWWEWVFPIMAFFPDRHVVRIPACPSCARWLRLTRWSRSLALVGILGLFLWYGHPYIKKYPRPVQKLLVVGACAICAVPWVLWDVIAPPPIDITARAESVDYEFRSAMYAEAFAEQNGVGQPPSETG